MIIAVLKFSTKNYLRQKKNLLYTKIYSCEILNLESNWKNQKFFFDNNTFNSNLRNSRTYKQI